MEKFGILEAGAPPAALRGRGGERSVLQVLEYLAENHGWVPEREHDGGPIIALMRGGALGHARAGRAARAVGRDGREHPPGVRRAARAHARDRAHLARPWASAGSASASTRSRAAKTSTWVPKQRYGVMREYLPTRGGHALDMMLRTCTVQVNLDYASEADAMRKMRVALALSPATTAMFANSPWKEGRPHGGVTYRGRVWLDVDPDRTGLLSGAVEAGQRASTTTSSGRSTSRCSSSSAADTRSPTRGRPSAASGRTASRATRPNMEDWKTHLNTLFPEVRLKKTIEMRGADVQSTDLACALPALWTGILYDDRALAEAEALVEGWTHDEVADASPARVA